MKSKPLICTPPYTVAGPPQHWRFYDARTRGGSRFGLTKWFFMRGQRTQSLSLPVPTGPHSSLFPFFTFSLFTFSLIALLLSAAAASGQINSDITAPIIKDLPKPDYPAAARAAGIGGDVIVVMLVGKNGKAKMVDSYGPMAPCTDLEGPLAASVRAAAVDAAGRATYSPATYKGKPVDKGVEITFNFHPLDGKDHPDDVEKVRSLPRANWPVAVTIPKAKYPRELGIKLGDVRYLGTMVGPIRVKMLIDENGRVMQAGAISGTQRIHRETAVEAACRSVFKPATRDGKPIKFEFIFEHNFYNDFQQKQK